MTVTKRRVTQPEIELQAIADIATWLAHQWPAIEATYAALAAPTIRAAGNPTRHNNTPDPTHTIVASLTPYSETREAITGALTQMRWLQTRARNILRHHPDIAADATATIRAMQCSGEIDPTCTRNAVRGELSQLQRASQMGLTAVGVPGGGSAMSDEMWCEHVGMQQIAALLEAWLWLDEQP